MDLSCFRSCFPNLFSPLLWSHPTGQSLNSMPASAATMGSSKHPIDTVQDPPQDNPNSPPEPSTIRKMDITSSLEDFQTEEQRRVLDTVAQVRKCGLESILSLPQLVVCGDQSAGKSSVLEALTEIPFPRNDNLCTRFATEIIPPPFAAPLSPFSLLISLEERGSLEKSWDSATISAKCLGPIFGAKVLEKRSPPPGLPSSDVL